MGFAELLLAEIKKKRNCRIVSEEDGVLSKKELTFGEINTLFEKIKQYLAYRFEIIEKREILNLSGFATIFLDWCQQVSIQEREQFRSSDSPYKHNKNSAQFIDDQDLVFDFYILYFLRIVAAIYVGFSQQDLDVIPSPGKILELSKNISRGIILN